MGIFIFSLIMNPLRKMKDYTPISLDLTIPYLPLDLLGPETEQLKPTSTYSQESTYPSDQVGLANPEETTCAQDEDSPMGSSQEIEDWTPEE
jgi:hypothetical protein